MVWELEFAGIRHHFARFELMQQSIEATYANGIGLWGPVCACRYADGTVAYSFALKSDPARRLLARGRCVQVWDEACVLQSPGG